MSRILFSIIICTNGRPDIYTTLRSIVNQKFPISKSSIEVIIISSSKLDTTKQILRIVNKQISNFHYVFSQQTGISFLRNIGIQRSKGKYICFVDDDTKLSRTWFAGLHRCMRLHPEAQIIFGEIYPLDNQTNKRELWIKKIENFSPWLLASASKNNTKSITPYTANVCIRADVFSEIGLFNEIFGSFKGPTPLPYGEDAEFFQRARCHSIRILFNKHMKIYHFINPLRSSLRYLFWRYIDHGKNTIVMYMLNSEVHSGGTKQLLRFMMLEYINDIPTIFHAFPLGILSVLGKFSGAAIMLYYIHNNKSYYDKFFL